ncbi:hypothetical protein ECTW09195_5242, partial [Escherichia coli TW09195]
MFYLSD